MNIASCFEGDEHSFMVTKWMKGNNTNSAREFVCARCLLRVHMDEVLRLESDRKSAGKACTQTASKNPAS